MVHKQKLSLVLSEFAGTLVTDFPIDGILDNLVKRIIEVLPVTAAGITLIQPGIKPRHVAASGDPALRYEALQSELFEGPSLLAFDSNQPVLIPELEVEERFPHFTGFAQTAGLRAVFAFPLRRGGTRIGALELYRDSPGELADHDVAAAQTLANVAAAYLTNVQARIDVDEATDGVRQSGLRDILTGLPNRQLLDQRVAMSRDQGRPAGTDSAVLFINLDRFKAVNDSHGHSVGDELLVAVAHRLGALVRPMDTLARVSADEFVILCTELADSGYVDVLANRIDKAFSFPFQLSDARISITASVGMAVGPGQDLSDQLVNDADTAMGQRKRKGGAGHQIIDLREATRALEWVALESDLRRAVADNRLELHYQPVVRSFDGMVTGVEALLRWTHPRHGPISPEVIVAMAERTGLIIDIGAWALSRACRDHRTWRERYPLTHLQVAVNVSTTQLMTPGFTATVASVLHRTNTTPADLVLEMTEAIFIEDSEQAGRVLRELNSLGVGVALDDFGTGYCSLNYLRRFPVDVLKIDQTFLVGVQDNDPLIAPFLGAVTQLAHMLGLSVIAEGVETPQQRDEVAMAGCESSQGFFYAKPMPRDDISRLLRDGSDGDAQVPHLPDTSDNFAYELPAQRISG